MHRKRTSANRVCSCTPTKGITYIDTRMLLHIVGQGIHAIRCARSARHKARRGLLLGDLCASAHHPHWAMRIWNWTRRAVEQADWDEWRYTPINTNYFRLANLTAEAEARELGARIDALWASLGHPEMGGYEAAAGWSYEDLWEDKYNVCRSDFDTVAGHDGGTEPSDDTIMADAMLPWKLNITQEWG